jgi:hypothetical protein
MVVQMLPTLHWLKVETLRELTGDMIKALLASQLAVVKGQHGMPADVSLAELQLVSQSCMAPKLWPASGSQLELGEGAVRTNFMRHHLPRPVR